MLCCTMKVATTSNSGQLLLYSTLGCHLCEVAEALIKQNTAFNVKVIDIAEDDKLMERYGVRIPALVYRGSSEELGWPFDAEQLQDFLHRCCAESPKNSQLF